MVVASLVRGVAVLWLVPVLACAVAQDPPRPLPPGNDPIARVARADAMLEDLSSKARGNRLLMGGILGLQGVIYGGLGIHAVTRRDESDDPDQVATAGGIALGIGVVCAALGIWHLASRTDEELVYADFRARAAIDPEPAIAASRHDLSELADRRHGQRVIVRTVGVIVVAGGVGGIIAGRHTNDNAYLGLGILGVVVGGVAALASFAKAPVEETSSRWRVELGATATASGARVPVLGVSGAF